MTAPIVYNVSRRTVPNVERTYRMLSRNGFATTSPKDELWPRIAEGKRRDG